MSHSFEYTASITTSTRTGPTRYRAATWGGFHLTGVWTSREKAFPTGAYETEFDNAAAGTTDKHRFLDLRYERAVTPNLLLTARVYTHHYGYEGVYPYETLFFDSTDNDWYGGELRAQWDPPEHTG